MLALLWVFPLALAERASTATGQQSSPQSETDHLVAYTDQDSYQIYAALLQSGGHSQYVHYVVQAEIIAQPGLTRNDLGIEGDEAFLRVWGRVMEDFARQNGSTRLLQRNFPLAAPYELIPQANIFPSGSGAEGWEEYYRRHPSSGGYYWFSAVGFNPARTRAIVDMGHSCGFLCGGGGPRFFERKKGKWREVSVKATVTSWVS